MPELGSMNAKEVASLDGDIARTAKKLDNPDFIARAPEEVVEENRERLAEAEERARDEPAKLRLRQEAKQLTLPEAMGERFQAMGFARDVEFGTAFLAGDLSYRL